MAVPIGNRALQRLLFSTSSPVVFTSNRSLTNSSHVLLSRLSPITSPAPTVKLLSSQNSRHPNVNVQFRSKHDGASQLPSSLTVLKFVPQQEAWIIERMGKFHTIFEPGLNVMIPGIDRVKYIQSLKELAIDIPQQSAITVDNVTLQIDGVLYLKVVDPYNASYGVEDAEFAITQLAQTTMRSEIGKISLDTVFRERESLNTAIVQQINIAADSWGIDCKRYEIRDISVPSRVKEAMQMQVEAERKKRAAILESEGIRESDINVAQGKKQAAILASEGLMSEKINIAKGHAEAIELTATARAIGLQRVADALQVTNGNHAASFAVAEQYVAAFSNLAKTGNTILLPSNTGDVASMVTQAMGVYKTLASSSAVAEDAGSEAANDFLDDDLDAKRQE